MKYRFPFEKLMQHRKNLEELAMRDVADAQRELKEANEIMGKYYSSIDECRENMAGLIREGGRVTGRLCDLDEFIKGQKNRIITYRETVRALVQKVEKCQLALVEKAREYKILDRLKVKQVKKQKKIEKKKEFKTVDDLVVMRFSREK